MSSGAGGGLGTHPSEERLAATGEGARLLRRKCSRCHVRPEIEGRSPMRWRAILAKHHRTVHLKPAAWEALEALVPEQTATASSGPGATQPATSPASASQPASSEESL